jgi:hypothetical protein
MKKFLEIQLTTSAVSVETFSFHFIWDPEGIVRIWIHNTGIRIRI